MQKINKHLLWLGIVIALIGCDKSPAAATDTSAPVVEERPLPIKRIAARVADRLPHTHLHPIEFDDRLAADALMLFIDSLDFDRSYFLQSDIEEFELKVPELDDAVRAGDVEFAQLVFERFKERVMDRTDYVNELLKRGFDVTLDEIYEWKRDDAAWPADQAEWDELWRKKIKNEYVTRLAMLETKEDEPEADLAEDEELEEEDMLSPDEFVRERYKQYRLMVETNFDRENILQRYLSAFTQSYDPHSAYLSPRGVEDFDIHMSLSLVGIGAMLRAEDGAAKITSLIAGGPAEEDGRLKAGDKIVAVAQGDEEPVSILYWPLSKAVRLIRGEKGSTVVLTVIPAEDKTGTRTKKIDLVRDEVKLEEQAAKGKVFDQIGTNALPHRLGVVTLPEFYADFEAARNGDADARSASADIRRILEGFSTNQVDGVIIDLRNDGGGSLNEAIDITGQFIPLGPVVQVRERRGVAVLPDGDPTTLYSGPLVVLVNRVSASASEILAAALQDYGRAVIVGDMKTHGKGTVQTVMPLSRLSDDLGSIKVTTASFYRIAGGSTQLKGVTPDVILPSYLDSMEIGEEYLDHALPWTQVRSAYYRPWDPSVKPFIPELQTRSAERIAASEEFKEFMERREKIRERMQTPEISLNLSNRVEEILAEREIEEMQEEMLAQDDDEEKEDIILDEALRILSDLIELSSGERVADVQRP